MTASTRINAFLWNRVSQGYSRVVRDSLSFIRWQAWRRGSTSRDLTASLYRTPSPSPPSAAPEQHCVDLFERPDSAAEEKQAQEETVLVAAVKSTVAQEKTPSVACAQNSVIRSATISNGGDSLGCSGVSSTTFAAPPNNQEWTVQFPKSDPLPRTSQATASTGSAGPLSRGQHILNTEDVPENMVLGDILCTFFPTERF